MVETLRCLATREQFHGRVAGKLAMVAFWYLGLATMLWSQEPRAHFWHDGSMPPGAIGGRQLQRGGPLPGFFQPVEIKAPAGALVSLATANQFDAPQPAPRRAGFLIGGVYRLRVTGIPKAEGLEVFPTIEVIDRLYAPADQQVRFAIPVELTREDMQLAIDGKMVTRVIYLENPLDANPARSDPQGGQNWSDVGPGRDLLAVADAIGRPMAILRMGGRVPDQGPDPGFFFGSPPFVAYPPRPEANSPILPARKAGQSPAAPEKEQP
jgi:hypothetical protein